ncbi:uncharacterized protein PGTG_12521 [Puccinia graminis f. sp. tritici CRL 75-36-700-3]|uniref:DUF7872 domain-containing protein n=1 Tax=Puccinia graminis f. sp. tritici (strain CRL 75-36-700-3 / race SCCL) TaxID=418459 RepID=E3KUX4_PUCGT|nr:uncharacterized protein PGTG_12521 [Puccinia graminis f. sp. tritici CRL 75-36-700-3]EFP88074.1 hypothetical protein PGTG_12521 [Puccinia graminis f. sp. tritici CRL 75-36-700-3]
MHLPDNLSSTRSLCIAALYATATLASITPPPGFPASVQPQQAPGTPASTPPPVKPQAVGTPPPPAPIPPANLPCVAQNLTADTWNRLQIDKYLATYPGGQSLTLSQYADSKGAQNFRCGIEEFCSSDSICNPVPAPDWAGIALSSPPQITFSYLPLEKSYSTLCSIPLDFDWMVIVVSALMVTGLAEQNIHAHEIAFGVGALTSLLASAAAIVGLAAATLFLAGFVFALAPIALGAGAVALVSTQVAPLAFGASSLLANKPEDKKSFIKWASVGNMFSQWEIHMQSMITNTTQTVINSPISSNAGISSVLRNGVFLFDTQTKSTSELQIDYETVLQARSLNLVLRAMGAFVTRGSDKCNSKGPNGAWGDEGTLSYCGPDKVMMNIVLAHGDKTKNKIQNAKYIATKFGFTTEYIVTQSWNCQQKYQQFEFDPYRDAPLPSDANADCVMNLPVCDLTDQRIDQARHGKHHHTTKACRTQGGLPI